MAESHLVSFKYIYPEIKKRHPLFSLNDIIEDENLNQINVVINEFSSNMYTLCVQYISSLKEAKSKILYLENKCASLEVKVNESKQTNCSECSKLRKELENYKNNKMDMLSNKTLFVDGNDNYTPEKKLSPEDFSISNVENTIIPTKPYLQTSDDTIKTPPSTSTKKKRDLSPIVQKQTRSGKRKALFMSSKRRSKLNDSIVNDYKLSPNCSDILANETSPEFEQKSVEDCVTPINDVDLSDDNIIEPSPLPVSKNNRKVNSFFSEKKIHEFENFNPDSAFNPLSINILENYEGIINDKNKNESKPSKKQKSVWNLKKSRGISNKKFKQTLLSTTVFSKPLDISTLDEFQGGLPPSEGKTSQTITAPDDMELTYLNSSFDAHIPKFNSSEKENQPNPIVVEKNFDSSQETFFDPDIKVNHECKKPVVKEPADKNSFDYIPEVSKSPNYKYRRDAVRKKSERQKLPGRECKNCCDFFIPNKKEPTDSQLNLINKFSRHRDKYPIISHTPPGLWNPKFSDSDDETE